MYGGPWGPNRTPAEFGSGSNVSAFLHTSNATSSGIRMQVPSPATSVDMEVIVHAGQQTNEQNSKTPPTRAVARNRNVTADVLRPIEGAEN